MHLHGKFTVNSSLGGWVRVQGKDGRSETATLSRTIKTYFVRNLKSL